MIIGTVVLGLISTVLGWVHPLLALLPLPVWVWLLAFFRDPERVIPQEPGVYVSPADGMVSDVMELPGHDLLNEPCVRIGIFLNVFNVHVNRSPCAGKVTQVVYKKGKFINAMSHNNASEQNESNTLQISDDAGKPVAVVKQIVGLIARRIICDVKPGDTVTRGERFGLIKFGSRTELYIPKSLNPVIKVTVGQKVTGAKDVVATVS